MHRALFGIVELADLFEVSKQTFSMRLKQDYYKIGYDITFPDPQYQLSAGRIWTWEQLQGYLQRVQKSGYRGWLSWKQQTEFEKVMRKLQQIGQMVLTDDGGVK